MSIIKEKNKNLMRRAPKKLKKKNGAVKVVKNIGKISLITLLGLSVAKEVSFHSQVGKGNYKSQKQIKNDAELLSADLKIAEYYVRNANKLKTLKHNNGKPIYVHIKDGYKQEHVDIIKEVLSDFNEMFKDINNNYKFEIADNSKILKSILLGETSIVIENSLDSETAQGLNISTAKKSLNTSFKTYISVIKTDFYSVSHNEVRYTIMHELLHSFGFGDVYRNTKADHYNTFMKPTPFNRDNGMLYPTDYAVLLSMYHNILGENGKVDSKKLKNATQLYENYTEGFYRNLLEYYKEKKIIINDYEINNEELFGNVFAIPLGDEVKLYDGNKTYAIRRDFVFLNNNKFILNIYREDNVIYSSTGEFKKIDNMIVMHDAKFGKTGYDEVEKKEVGLEEIRPVILIKDIDGYRFLLADSTRARPVSLRDFSSFKMPTNIKNKNDIISKNIINAINNNNIIFKNNNVVITLNENEEENIFEMK